MAMHGETPYCAQCTSDLGTLALHMGGVILHQARRVLPLCRTQSLPDRDGHISGFESAARLCVSTQSEELLQP